MLERIKGKIIYSKAIKKYLRSLKPWKGAYWEKRDNSMKFLKKSIKQQLKYLQDNKCIYCGLKLDETSTGEIEHIAPKKGRPNARNYEEFMFIRFNLALACRLCNSSSKKGTIDTVLTFNKNYKMCDFSIVHPYFDEPNDHYSWAGEMPILISYKTAKGKASIEMFDLSSSIMTEARIKQYLIDQYRLQQPKKYEDLIKETIDYK